MCSTWFLSGRIVMRDSAPLNSLLYIQSAVRYVLRFRYEARCIPQRAEKHVGGSLGPVMVLDRVALLLALATQNPRQPHLSIFLGGLVHVCCSRCHVGGTSRQA